MTTEESTETSLVHVVRVVGSDGQWSNANLAEVTRLSSKTLVRVERGDIISQVTAKAIVGALDEMLHDAGQLASTEHLHLDDLFETQPNARARAVLVRNPSGNLQPAFEDVLVGVRNRGQTEITLCVDTLSMTPRDIVEVIRSIGRALGSELEVVAATMLPPGDGTLRLQLRRAA